MAEVLQLRCELEQLAIIKEVMFGGILIMIVEVVLILSYNVRAKS